VTVIDLGQVMAMPSCTMLLAAFGARVIKVKRSPHERPPAEATLSVDRRTVT
jgi:crotonobetainyl-CoA:carnitine CoA-transferase CaiB-like acyl-CoA transferase